MKSIFILLLLLVSLHVSAQMATVSGYIRDFRSGEELIGATVMLPGSGTGTVTNVYGFYSLSIKRGKCKLKYSYIGYANRDTLIDLQADQKIDIYLDDAGVQIEAVTIEGEAVDKNVQRVEMSVNKLQMKTIKKIPMMLGEVDVLRTIQLLPGVQNGGEGTTGFYVRGGGVDQNLILFDDAPVYNAAHAGGIFSVFNGDVVKDVKLYKGGIAGEYGGRLSSVLDIRMKDGDMREYHGTGGLGAISSRLTLEGPLVKDKSSVIVSGRRTYIDLFFPLAKDTAVHDAVLYFHDFNTKVNWIVNDKNRLYYSVYLGRDVIRPSADFQMSYGNFTNTVRWNHLFSSKIFSNFMFIFSNFDYNLGIPEGEMAFQWKSNIIDYSLKNDYTYYLNPDNTIKTGWQSTLHKFIPGITEKGEDSFLELPDLDNRYALEHAVYLSNEQKVTHRLSVDYGVRLSLFQNMGSTRQYYYNSQHNVSDSTDYPLGEIYNHYFNIEPRLSMRILIDGETSIKASYNRMAQYIHLATNTASATPLDVWFPSSPVIKPQLADQVAVGIFRNFMNNSIETSIETYYKKMYNTIDFKDHAQLLLNPYLEGEMRIGNSYSYGVEMLVRRETGKLTGWLSYTWCKTTREIPEVNGGVAYAAPYDKTHDFAAVGSYDITPRTNFSCNWIYTTPQPRTMPTGRFEYGKMIAPVYSDRNTIRLYPYHRLDISLTIEGKNYSKPPVRINGKRKFAWHSSWNFSVYNTYARKNPYSISFKQIEGSGNETQAEMLYLFKALPSVTYNFKF